MEQDVHEHKQTKIGKEMFMIHNLKRSWQVKAKERSWVKCSW